MYTRPDLRKRLKKRLLEGDRGGRKGQWSARKAQLLIKEYEAHEGGYLGPRSEQQLHLEKWTDEQWQTRDGAKRARHGRATDRYLPKKAWEQLSVSEQSATDRKKKRASLTGRQYVANTRRARQASRKVRLSKSRPDDGEKQKISSDFKEAVNMTAKELKSWLGKNESKSVGQKKNGSSESVGHASGRKIIRIENKKESELTPSDYQHMKKVVGYVRRHLAQGPSHDMESSRWRYSLMNWGHDPVKTRGIKKRAA